MRLKEIAVKLNNLNLNEKLLILYIIILPIMRMPSLPLFKQKIQYSDLVFVVLLITWTIKIYRKKISLEKTPF